MHIVHESKFPFVSRHEFIRSKLSIFSAHVSGVSKRGAIRRPLVNVGGRPVGGCW